MTLDEAIRKANNGDVGAMVAVGQFYYDKFGNTYDSDDLKSAIVWYEKAANFGDFNAKRMAVMLWQIEATTRSALYGTFHDKLSVLEAWQNMREWCLNIKPHCSGSHLTEVNRNLTESSYQCALYEFMCDRENVSITLLNGLNDTRSVILRGICEFNLANTDSQVKTAFNNMCNIQKDEAYAKSEKSPCEDFVFAAVAIQMSILYRSFFKPQDLTKAAGILSYAKRFVKDEKGLILINRELSKYKEKLFGGYKYIG